MKRLAQRRVAVTARRGWGVLLASLLVGGCGASDSAAPRVAQRFVERRFAGDMKSVWEMLAASDQRLVPENLFPDSAYLEYPVTGVPTAEVDSARLLNLRGDTARVLVFGNVANLTQAGQPFVARAFSPDSDRGPDFLNKVSRLPRVLSSDTITLVREGRGWRVWVDVPAAKRERADLAVLSRLYDNLTHGYLNRTLHERAEDARRFLAAAQTHPRAARHFTMQSPREIVEGAAVADSLEWRVDLSRGGYLSVVHGQVVNHSSRDVKQATVRLRTDAGDEATLSDISVMAGQTAPVFDPGSPRGTRVVQVVPLDVQLEPRAYARTAQ